VAEIVFDSSALLADIHGEAGCDAVRAAPRPGAVSAMNFAEVTLARDSGRLWAMAPGLKIGVPDRIAQRANGRDGVKATIGIRPEDIHIAGPADGAESCFEAEVEVVEQLGSEILLDTRVGNTAFVASVDPGLHMRVHERLKLALNPTRLHLFDAETEAAI